MKEITQPDELIDRIALLEEEAVIELVRQRIAAGDNPLDIIDACQHGMRLVGERYAEGAYYIAGLIMAGEIFRQTMDIVLPLVEPCATEETAGCILLGTVQSDIHDLGKNIAGMLLRCHGFSVFDLGVDVSPARFVEQIREREPDILGLCGLLTASYEVMRETVAAVREATATWPRRLPIIIGGGNINAQICEYVQADSWTTDAMEGVHLCQQMVGDR